METPTPSDKHNELEVTMTANEVCCIYELVEMTLIELPLYDVINLTGVNKTFNACINSSSKLYEKLFLKQIKNNIEEEGQILLIVNPAIERIVRRCHAAWNEASLVECRIHTTDNRAYPFRIRSRGACTKLSIEMLGQKGNPRPRHYYLNLHIELTFAKHVDLLSGNGEIGADESWREMYLTDRMCDVYTSVKMNMNSPSVERKLDLPPTTTMADLLDGVDFMIRQQAHIIKAGR